MRGTPLAIIIGSLVIAAAILYVFRWDFVLADGQPIIRVDHWSGQAVPCVQAPAPGTNSLVGGNLRCTP